MYINKVILFGNLTRDPELKALPGGSQVTSFSLATNRVFKKPDGTKQEVTDFHNIVVFGRQAETAAQYLKKGGSVFIEGRIQTRSWESEKGKQYRTEIIAEQVQFGPRAAGTGSGASTPTSSSSYGAAPAAKAPSEESIDYPTEDINPDDIPF